MGVRAWTRLATGPTWCLRNQDRLATGPPVRRVWGTSPFLTSKVKGLLIDTPKGGSSIAVNVCAPLQTRLHMDPSFEKLLGDDSSLYNRMDSRVHVHLQDHYSTHGECLGRFVRNPSFTMASLTGLLGGKPITCRASGRFVSRFHHGWPSFNHMASLLGQSSVN